jgi:hypothetical protein
MEISDGYEQHFKKLTSVSNIGIDCIDDRGYAVVRPNIKTAAGPLGIALDTMSARSFNNYSNSELNRPVGEMAKVVAITLGLNALDACVHHECAAELNARPIADFIINQGEATLATANIIAGGDIAQSDFEQVQQFYTDLRSSDHILRPAEQEAACMDTDATYPKIKRLHLSHDNHASGMMVSNDRKDTWYDAASAYKQGNGLYVIDTWAQPKIAEIVDTVIQHDNVKGFLAASAIRHAVISHLLPSADGLGQGVTPLYRAA